MMDLMTPDTTGQGTQDAGHVLRAPAPQAPASGVPYPPDFWDQDTGHGTYSHEQDVPGPDPQDVPSPVQDTRQDTLAGAPQDTPDVPQDTKTPSRWAVPALVSRAQVAWRRRQDGIRSTEDALRDAQRRARQDDQAARDALSRESTVRRRRAGRAEAGTDTVAPIPDWMKTSQVWAERLGGTALKLSPLVASGYFTYDVGRDAPLNMNAFVALFLVGGLEGSVWYLNRLREKFKLENDSTLSIAVAIFGIIALIFALIGGHAIWKSAGRVPIWIDLPGTDSQVPVAELVPAVAVALMSAIGAFIWAKEATYKHRAKLRALGQIDPRAPRISAGAWMFTWWESICSLRHAFKYRVTSRPTEDWRHWKAAGKPKIWPIPDGFRWDGQKLIAVPVDELRDMAERDALLATIAELHDAGRRHAEQRDTAAITGRGPAGRPALPAGPNHAGGAGHGTPNGGTSPAANGTQDGGQRGTQDGAGADGRRGTPGPDHGTDSPNGRGTQDGHGTQDGAQDGHGTRGSGEVEIDAKLLRHADKAMIVMGVFDGSTPDRPHWRTSPKPPSVRAINAAIDAWRRQNEGSTFNSKDIAGQVQKLITRMRENPDVETLVRVQAEGDEQPST